MKARTIHYSIALWTTVFITISAVTGLLWAYAPYLYWEGGYKERKQSINEVPLSHALVTPQAVASLLGQEPTALQLISDAGSLFYRASIKGSKSKILIDARSAAKLSPLTDTLAGEFAKQYVSANTFVKSATSISNWKDGKGVVYDSVWRVEFNDAAESEVVLDQAGEVLEDSDKIRRFHFWVMDLHQFNFFGTHKVLSAVSGVPLLILIATGALLSVKRLALSRRRR